MPVYIYIQSISAQYTHKLKCIVPLENPWQVSIWLPTWSALESEQRNYTKSLSWAFPRMESIFRSTVYTSRLLDILPLAWSGSENARSGRSLYFSSPLICAASSLIPLSTTHAPAHTQSCLKKKKKKMRNKERRKQVLSKQHIHAAHCSPGAIFFSFHSVPFIDLICGSLAFDIC